MWDYIKLKNFCMTKRKHQQKRKGSFTEWEKVLINHISDKELIAKYKNNSYKSTASKISNQLKHRKGDLNINVPKADI